MKEVISPQEIARLDELVQVVNRGQKTFIEVGAALLEIRENKLYRRDFNTFEAFCQKQWGWSSRRANQLIQSTMAVSDLDGIVPQIQNGNHGSHLLAAPILERQARELAKVPKTDRPAVLEAVAAAGPVTAKAIRQAAATVAKADPVETVIRDSEGWPIPPEAQAIWARRNEPQEFMTAISRVKCALEKLGIEDPLYGGNFQHIIGDLEAAHHALSTCRPHAVCTDCDGRPMKRKPPCGSCHCTGMVSKAYWDRNSRLEVKEKRAKEIARRAA